MSWANSTETYGGAASFDIDSRQNKLLYNQPLEEASPPQSVVLTTTDHIDLGRGDMLVSADEGPTVSSKITSYLIWMSHDPLRNDARYLIKHTTRVLCGRIRRLNHKIDVNTLETVEADSLHFNEIGEVQIDLQSPIFCDPYERDRSTGSFIVIDPHTNDTVAAGMIVGASPQGGESVEDIASRVAQQRGLTVVHRTQRSRKNYHLSCGCHRASG